ncbi:Mechanosensitive ion channel [Pustulibacterium marinum]|uniref:Mechanosensitive ion channel n=1 Tax=Pustulibacterium marinum TaxID=1224947 RepID=A0A1I7F181_9FLAO|nr:mechanosensitive ion channel domain-containing protein [Pustulibacterium marinum]SFU29914.1 Mechanosensitive ion channel [Pustulibacterium marinum]
MSKYCQIVTTFFLTLLLAQFSFAQNDSIQIDSLRLVRQADSVNTVMLNSYNEKIARIEAQRVADSIKKAQLEAQIAALKTTDNLKKEELEQQLQMLNNQEAQRLAQKKAEIDVLRASSKSYPVTGFFKDTLFVIYSRLGSFSASDRASAITKRIKNLSDQFKFDATSIKIVGDDPVDLRINETILMSVSENDALWNSTSKIALANSYQKIITDEVVRYRSETSVVTLVKEIALAVLVLVIMILIIKYSNKLFRWTALKIHMLEGYKLHGIKIKDYVLLDSDSQVQALLIANKVVKWLFIIMVMYLTLPILFGIFPWTQNFAETIFNYTLNPVKGIFMGFWNYLPNLITITVTVIVFRYLNKGVKYFKNEIATGKLEIPGFYPDWANPTYQIVRILLYAFMFVMIFPYIPGSDSDIFKGVSVFLGFLFTFGSAGSVSNIIAGIVLTYMRLFKIGDRVKIGDISGDIIEKNMLVTRIRTTKNEIISIPNSTVMNSHTINYSSDAPEKGLIIHTTVTIGYDIPWKLMYETLIEAALRTDLILKEPKPFVLQTSLEDFYVAYQINAYVREANKQAKIYSDLHQHIQDVCNENGIEILSPHYRAARDGNKTTIPEDYLPKDYKTPGFNVNVNKEEANSDSKE